MPGPNPGSTGSGESQYEQRADGDQHVRRRAVALGDGVGCRDVGDHGRHRDTGPEPRPTGSAEGGTPSPEPVDGLDDLNREMGGEPVTHLAHPRISQLALTLGVRGSPRGRTAGARFGRHVLLRDANRAHRRRSVGRTA